MAAMSIIFRIDVGPFAAVAISYKYNPLSSSRGNLEALILIIIPQLLTLCAHAQQGLGRSC